MDSLVLDKGFGGPTAMLLDNKRQMAPPSHRLILGCFLVGTNNKEDSTPK